MDSLVAIACTPCPRHCCDEDSRVRSGPCSKPIGLKCNVILMIDEVEALRLGVKFLLFIRLKSMMVADGLNNRPYHQMSTIST